MKKNLFDNFGAGEGNRTLVFSLEGCCSTIELHPRIIWCIELFFDYYNRLLANQHFGGLQMAIFCAPMLMYPKVHCASVLKNDPFR